MSDLVMYGCVAVSGLMAGASLVQYVRNRMAIELGNDLIRSVLTKNREELVQTTAKLVVEKVAPRVDINLVANGVIEVIINDYADEILDRVVDNIVVEKE